LFFFRRCKGTFILNYSDQLLKFSNKFAN